MSSHIIPGRPLLPPQPGVYPDVDFATYSRWSAVNHSLLKKFDASTPAHVHHYLTSEPEDERRHFVLGRALHALMESEAAYVAGFKVATKCCATTKQGKPCRAPVSVCRDGGFYCASHKPETGTDQDFVKPEEDRQLRAMRERLMSRFDIRHFLSDPVMRELSIVWMDEETGLPMKARLDLFSPSWERIGDWKTCVSAEIEAFRKACWEFGYFSQSEFYLTGARAVGLVATDFAILPVEKEPPHEPAAYVVDEEAVLIGREANRRNKLKLAECLSTGIWRGHAEDFPQIGVPWFARRRGLEAAA